MKNPGQGFGVELSDGKWYWYERWVERVRAHCEEDQAAYTSQTTGENQVPEEIDAPFSRRHGYYRPADREITVREDAPDRLRYYVLQIAVKVGMRPHELRSIACEVLRLVPDPDNWSEYPNVWDEVTSLLEDCDWYRVYDIAEAIHAAFKQRHDDTAVRYEQEMNDFLREAGIGWEMQGGKVVARGSESFAAATHETPVTLEAHGRSTAAGEIRHALEDLSRRPESDTTGAIQHAMAALECVARDVAGDGSTLGELINRHASALGIGPPLDQALHKLWGYASQRGRHLQEGLTPSFEEAELVVTVAAAVSTYMSKKAAGKKRPLPRRVADQVLTLGQAGRRPPRESWPA